MKSQPLLMLFGLLVATMALPQGPDSVSVSSTATDSSISSAIVGSTSAEVPTSASSPTLTVESTNSLSATPDPAVTTTQALTISNSSSSSTLASSTFPFTNLSSVSTSNMTYSCNESPTSSATGTQSWTSTVTSIETSTMNVTSSGTYTISGTPTSSTETYTPSGTTSSDPTTSYYFQISQLPNQPALPEGTRENFNDLYLTSFSTGRGTSDPVFQSSIDLDQYGWFNNSILHWSSPPTGTVSFTLVMEYDSSDVNRQSVSIDDNPGTPGLALDDNQGLIVTGGLSIVWKGWVVCRGAHTLKSDPQLYWLSVPPEDLENLPLSCAFALIWPLIKLF